MSENKSRTPPEILFLGYVILPIPLGFLALLKEGLSESQTYTKTERFGLLFFDAVKILTFLWTLSSACSGSHNLAPIAITYALSALSTPLVMRAAATRK